MSKHVTVVPQAITVWRWADAPVELRALSDGVGNGLWVAMVPKVYVEEVALGWLDRIDTLDTPLVVDHPTMDGYEVWIGA